MSKPITKALHTVRVVRILAGVVRSQALPQGSGAYLGRATVYARVLELLDNADTADTVLRDALLEACATGGQS